MTPTEECYKLIKNFEDVRLKAYKCPAGVWTIGYGHTDGVKAEDKITEEQALEYLKSDVNIFAKKISKALNADEIELETVHQFDALVCFAFNVGASALINSTLWKRLKANDYAKAAAQFLCWNKAKVNGKYVVLNGLTRRRTAEMTLFLKRDQLMTMYLDKSYKDKEAIFLKQYQPIDVIRNMPYNLGSAIKYLIIAGDSDELPDYACARDYLEDFFKNIDDCYKVKLDIDARQALSVYVTRNNLIAKLFKSWCESLNSLKIKTALITYKDISDVIDILDEKLRDYDEANDE